MKHFLGHKTIGYALLSMHTNVMFPRKSHLNTFLCMVNKSYYHINDTKKRRLISKHSLVYTLTIPISSQKRIDQSEQRY